MSETKKTPNGGDKPIDVARRRLLAKAVYVPPTVIGALALSLEGCQVASCNPSSCNPNGGPCMPSGEPCNPDGGACNPNGGVCNPDGGACNPSQCGPDVCMPAG